MVKERKAACWMEKKEKCPCKNKSLILGDGKVRGKSALFNLTLTQLNTPWRERKIPGGWNSQREANKTHCDQGPVRGTIKKIKNNPGGLNSQKSVSDTKHDPCSA